MGNAGGTDKRSFRKEYSSYFQAAIEHFETFNNVTTAKSTTTTNFKDSSIDVVVRLRPIFQYELDKGEYQVIRCVSSATSTNLPKNNCVLVHKCLPGPDFKPINAYVEHYGYPFPPGHIFNENHSTADVYQSVVKPVVQFVLSEQRHSTSNAEQRGTIFMYGQTGTGKTYTITGLVQQLSKDLFQQLSQFDRSANNWQVSVQCLEMINDNLYDLNNGHKEVRLLQASSDGRDIHIVGATQLDVFNENDLWGAYHSAAQLRETHATAINSQSSRSHYIFRIIIEHNGLKFARLTLVDLAGSERNADSLFHDADRQRESAWINSSLSALKDVIRTVTQGAGHIPFRASKLTQLLRDSFEGNCKTLVISTMSPIATDTEHTMNTLQHMSLLANASSMRESEPSFARTTVSDVEKMRKTAREGEEQRLKPVSKWTTEECRTWISTVDKGRYAKHIPAFPSALNGAQMARFTAQRFAQITGDPDVGAAMRKALDKYNEMVSKQKVAAASETRERLGMAKSVK